MALTNNLVAYWKLDESTGNASDSSGNGKTLTNNSVSYSAGKINNAGNFNGSNGQFSRSDMGLAPGFISISFWVKPTSLPTSGNFMSMIARYANFGTYGYDFRLHNDAGTQKIQFTTGATYTVTSSTTLSTSVWSHLAVTADGSNMYLYLNGSQIATSAVSTLGSENIDFFIGAINYGAGIQRYFNGSIDEVGIWSRALSGAEVTQLYNSGAGLSYPFTSPNTSNFFQFL